MLHNAINVFRAYGVIDSRRTTTSNNIEHHIGSIFRSRFHIRFFGKLGKVFSRHLRVPAVAGNKHILRIATAAVIQNQVNHFILDCGSGFLIGNSGQHSFPAALLRLDPVLYR